MNRTRTFSSALIVALSVVALAGCADIEDIVQNESSVEYDTTSEVAERWEDSVPWLPEDASRIRIHHASGGDPAILLSTGDAALDPALCVETARRSAPAYTEDWSPESYVDTVFACGDWAVIPTDTGWYGWTPNHPEEKAASRRLSSD